MLYQIKFEMDTRTSSWRLANDSELGCFGMYKISAKLKMAHLKTKATALGCPKKSTFHLLFSLL